MEQWMIGDISVKKHVEMLYWAPLSPANAPPEHPSRCSASGTAVRECNELVGSHRSQFLDRLVDESAQRGRIILLHPLSECHLENGHAGLGGQHRRVR
jgi:hypothetical protein